MGSANEARRHAWVEQELSRLAAGQRLLDAGAGEQQYRRHCAHLDYVSQDFAQYDGQGNAAGLHTGSWDTTSVHIVCDVTSIPEPDRSFDAVLCTEVLEHIPDPQAALREFARLLRPGGTLILTAPFASLTHFAPYHFSSGFSRYFYERWLGELGFEIRELVANGNFFEYLSQELVRIRSVSQKYGKPVSMLDFGLAMLLAYRLKSHAGEYLDSSELLAFGFHVRAVRRAGAGAGN